MRASTVLAVGFAGVVAVAAVASGIRGSGDDDSPAATTVATTRHRRRPRRPPRPRNSRSATSAACPARCGGIRWRSGPVRRAELRADVIALAALTVEPTEAPTSCVVWTSPGGTAFAHVGRRTTRMSASPRPPEERGHRHRPHVLPRHAERAADRHRRRPGRGVRRRERAGVARRPRADAAHVHEQRRVRRALRHRRVWLRASSSSAPTGSSLVDLTDAPGRPPPGRARHGHSGRPGIRLVRTAC